MFPTRTRMFSQILVLYVEMLIMHILQLDIDGYLMYFMDDVNLKSKFLLPLFSRCILFWINRVWLFYFLKYIFIIEGLAVGNFFEGLAVGNMGPIICCSNADYPQFIQGLVVGNYSGLLWPWVTLPMMHFPTASGPSVSHG